MRLIPPILSIVCLLPSSPLGAGDPDISLTHSVTYALNDAKGHLNLKVSHEVDQTFLSQRSTQHRSLPVFESPFAEVKNLRATFRGRELSKYSFSFWPVERGDIFISSLRRHEVNLPEDLKVGERVSYAWEEHFLDPAFASPIWVPNVDSLKGFVVTVNHPPDIEVAFEVRFPQAPLPYRVGARGPTSTSLTFEALAWQEPLPFLDGDEAHALVLPVFKRKGELLTPTNPRAFATWYLGLLPLMELRQEAVPKGLAESLTRAQRPREKLALLHDFVRERIRYAADEMGLNAIIPRTPETVLQRGYGDCKDKAFLLKALAAMQGIPVDVVLVADEPWTTGAPIHMGLFNHVICHYEDGDRGTFFDPTYRDVPFGALPVSDVARQGFILDASNPRMITIPSLAQRPWVEVRIRGQVGQLRKAKAEVTLRGDIAALARRGRRELRPLDQENQLSNTLNQHLQKVSLDHFTFESDTPEEVRFQADANLEDFLVASSTRYYLPQVPFRTHGPDLLMRSADTYPLDLSAKPWLFLDLVLGAEGVQVKPGRFELAAPGPTTFSAVCESLSGGVHLRYEFQSGLGRIGGADKASFLQFHEQLSRQRRQLFILTRSAP